MALDWYNGSRTTQKQNKEAQNKGIADFQDTKFIQDPAWGTGGTTFQGILSRGAVDALKGATSSANPNDIAAMDAMRDYWTTALGDVSANSRNQMNQFDTQSQRGLANLLAQHRNASAGTGTMGSRQYAGAQGDITSRVAGDYMRGVMANRQQELGNAAGIQQGLAGIFGQDLMERNFQLQQGKTLADQYNRMWDQQQGRAQHLDGMQDDSNWIADVAPLLGTGLGFAFGGPMGAMAGSALGGGLSQAMGGGGGGGGSNLATLLAMQNMNKNTDGGGLPMESPMAGDFGYSVPGAHQASGLSRNPYYPGNEHWRTF